MSYYNKIKFNLLNPRHKSLTFLFFQTISECIIINATCHKTDSSQQLKNMNKIENVFEYGSQNSILQRGDNNKRLQQTRKILSNRKIRKVFFKLNKLQNQSHQSCISAKHRVKKHLLALIVYSYGKQNLPCEFLY